MLFVVALLALLVAPLAAAVLVSGAACAVAITARGVASLVGAEPVGVRQS